MTSPAPTDNPIIQFIHSSSDSDINSYAAFAKTADITIAVINNVRKGLYNSLPPSVGKVLVQYSNRDISYWSREYRDWRLDQLNRLKTQIQLGQVEAVPLFVPANMLADYYDTFSDWRKEINASMMGFCTDFLLPHATITRYERGEGVKLPAVLIERLEFLGMTDDYIKELTKLPRRMEEINYA